MFLLNMGKVDEMNFKKLELEDKRLFENYIYPYTFLSWEYSFTTLYIWKDACDVQYTIYKAALIIKKKDFEGNYHFMQPLGYKDEDLEVILEELKNYKENNNMKYIFKDLDEEFVEKTKVILINHEKVQIEEDRDNFDYLYESEKLISLSGKKLHKKKNHYNAFVKKYEYEVKEINSKEIIEDVIEVANEWFNKNEHKDEILYYENLGIKNILRNIEFLNLKGIATYVDNKVVGFTVGEELNNNLAIIHIEKGDIDYRGIYSFINRTFIMDYFSDVKIINREQDLGIEGMRKAKMAYYPVKLEKKFILNW